MGTSMSDLFRSFVFSDNLLARSGRSAYRGLRNFAVPAPRWLTRPMLAVFLLLRGIWYFLIRVFICEPLFKASCTRYGKNLHTDVFIHWVQGFGDLIIGDDVTIDGRCHFHFAMRYVDRPVLRIGDRTGIGHNCAFVVGREINIGRFCRIASSVTMFDSPGHPTDPAARLAGLPAEPGDVRPISIADNVWIGTNAVIFPGVSVGENSVISMNSVVMQNVPANVVVAGNPARQIARIPDPGEPDQPVGSSRSSAKRDS
jgi:acetyltransferase-like isoleucine patch superfamily enzyme